MSVFRVDALLLPGMRRDPRVRRTAAWTSRLGAAFQCGFYPAFALYGVVFRNHVLHRAARQPHGMAIHACLELEAGFDVLCGLWICENVYSRQIVGDFR